MSAPESPDHVSVHLTGCGYEAAGTVFGVLEAAFPEGAGPPLSEPQPTASSTDHPIIWCMVVDTRGHRPGAATGLSEPLGEQVSVDLFGAADPVRQVREELESAFAAEDRGTVSGEHELEVRLRLSSRPASQGA
ncbi:hypothetical protein AB0K09_32935 [Streptomyces sp. NPDC049577]|uniref:hypothetical protein n=1 Tax=Streptomyces sp. NPDC049577 TaxID=3155153 RepID=UPI00342360E1